MSSQRIADPQSGNGDETAVVRPDLRRPVVEGRERDLQVEHPGSLNSEPSGSLEQPIGKAFTGLPNLASRILQRSKEPGRLGGASRGLRASPDA